MDKDNPEIRVPQRFINRVGKIKVGIIAPVPWNKAKLNLKEIVQSLHLNPVCPPGINNGPYGSRPEGYTGYYWGRDGKRCYIAPKKPRPNEKCACGSGLKYKKCCYLTPREKEE